MDWRSIVAALEHGVVVLDERSRIVASNAAAERLLGRDADALEGRRADELDLVLVGEDGAALDPAALPSLAALRTGMIQRDTLLGIARERCVAWLKVTATPLDAGDGLARASSRSSTSPRAVSGSSSGGGCPSATTLRPCRTGGASSSCSITT